MKKLKKNLKLDEIVTIDGIHSYVAFINHGDYWISPSDDNPIKGLTQGVCFAKIDSKGNVKVF